MMAPTQVDAERLKPTQMLQDSLTLKAKGPQTLDGVDMDPEGGAQTCSSENDVLGEMAETIRAVPTIGRTST